MKYLAFVVAVMVLALWIPHKMDEAYAKGLSDGRRTALHTSPVSEELELVCAGLWVGEQAKKAAAK